MPRKLVVIAVVMAFFAASCASSGVNQAGHSLADDEEKLWKRAKEEERMLDSSGHIYEDPALDSYLNQIARSIVPETELKRIDLRVKVIKSPFLNAFAYADGAIYINTGIIARMDNEGQLAALIGHEVTHALKRHSLKRVRSEKAATALVTAIQIAAFPLGIVGGGVAAIAGSIGGAVAVTGYTKEQETEADREGFRLIKNAGYDPEEALRLFEHLKKNIEEENLSEPFFFGTHPRIQERIDNFQELLVEYRAKEGSVKEEKRAQVFREKTKRLTIDNAVIEIMFGRVDSAEKGIMRFLEMEPNNARARYLLAELYRHRNRDGDLEKAEREYLISASLDPKFPSPHRSLWIIYHDKGLKEKANEEFDKYLDLSTDIDGSGEAEKRIQNMK